MQETVLITGASSGIGLELAKLFAADKSHLVLVARSRDKLEKLAQELRGAGGVECRVLPQDLADPAGPRAVFADLTAAGVTVDVVVAEHPVRPRPRVVWDRRPIGRRTRRGLALGHLDHEECGE